VAVLLIDASEGLVALDLNILGKAKESGKGIILVINKIDLIPGDRDKYMAEMLWQLQEKINFAPWLPIVFISAEVEENINSLLNQVVTVAENRQTEISEDKLVLVLAAAKDRNFQLENIKSLTQKSTNPPAFEIRFPLKYKPHFTQVRYLENKIRDAFPMTGTPIFIDSVTTGRKRRNRDKK
jgi:GTP-binding protein